MRAAGTMSGEAEKAQSYSCGMRGCLRAALLPCLPSFPHHLPPLYVTLISHPNTDCGWLAVVQRLTVTRGRRRARLHQLWRGRQAEHSAGQEGRKEERGQVTKQELKGRRKLGESLVESPFSAK